jgi:hypothetical protein
MKFCGVNFLLLTISLLVWAQAGCDSKPKPSGEPQAGDASAPLGVMPPKPAEVRLEGPVDAGTTGLTLPTTKPVLPSTGHLLLPVHGVVLLENGTLLVWAADGRIQLGSPETGWGPVVQLPMTYITGAASDVEGGLLGGSLFPPGGVERAVAVTVDARGTIRSRWEGHEELFSDVTSAMGRRWAVALDELLELSPDGRVLSAGKVPRLSQLLVGREGQQVLCTPANRTLAQAAPAACRAKGIVEWSVQGTWEHSPLVCDQWLVTYEGSALVIRLLSDGKQVSRRSASVKALACGRPGELLVGARQVQGLALPSLETRWQQPCGRATVVALASNTREGACLNAKGGIERLVGSADPQ